MLRKSRLVLYVCVSCFSISCASTNFSNIEDKNQFEHVVDEKNLWKQVEEIQRKLVKSGALYPDKELNGYVNALLDKLVGDKKDAWGDREGADIEARVVYDSDFNASIYPNGFMIIHTGLLANIENESQLVTVMGHELTHYLHRHALKGQNKLINVTAALSTLSVTATGAAYGLAYSGYDPSAVQSIHDSIALGLQGMFYGYNRSQETDADANAFDLMKNLGYDPGEAKKTFENMYKAQALIDKKTRVPYFYHSHPKTRARIRNFGRLIERLQKDNPENQNAQKIKGEKEYLARIKNLLLDNLELDLKKNRLKLARSQMDKYTSCYAEDYKSLYYEALVLSREDKKDEAMEKLMKSKELNPDNPKVLKELGFQLYKRGDKENANENFKKFLRLRPDAVDVDFIRGYINE